MERSGLGRTRMHMNSATEWSQFMHEQWDQQIVVSQAQLLTTAPHTHIRTHAHTHTRTHARTHSTRFHARWQGSIQTNQKKEKTLYINSHFIVLNEASHILCCACVCVRACACGYAAVVFGWQGLIGWLSAGLLADIRARSF